MSRNFDGGENLEENKDYRVYRYGDDLKPGYELKVEHSVSCENVDISASCVYVLADTANCKLFGQEIGANRRAGCF